MKEILLIVLVGLFILVLVLRALRGVVSRRYNTSDARLPKYEDPELDALLDKSTRSAKEAREALKKLGRRATVLESANTGALYRCAQGHISLNQLKRPSLAAGFYLRALREDPACVEAITLLQEILTTQRRFGRLEWAYWDVLGRIDDIEENTIMWTKCWSGLAALYSASPRKVRRADAIRKALVVFGPEDLDELDSEVQETIEENNNVPKVVS
ncbi:MAG: hypothetical protein GY762_08640 [Proteobacteria bacterium]|nr:hypothetical protein [Pseudomonadota bacterium]